MTELANHDTPRIEFGHREPTDVHVHLDVGDMSAVGAITWNHH